MNDDQIIWTVEDVAGFLKMKPSAVYSLTRNRGQVRSDVPLPVLKIHNKALRFRKSDVLGWIDAIAAQGRAQ
jgi:predicted DNA-binding transcriptional regulator AlpA